MSAPASPLGTGLYFIDVLACLLFCITLALVGARFGYEQTVAVDLPRLERGPSAGAGGLSSREVTLRSGQTGPELFLDGEPVSFAELEARLADSPSVVVRSEESALTRVIGIAHAAGVPDIELAYETPDTEGGR